MNLLAASSDPDRNLFKLIVILLIVAGVLIRKALEWWQNNRGTLLEKFKQLDEEFNRRRLGESAPPPLHRAEAPPPLRPAVEQRRAASPAQMKPAAPAPLRIVSAAPARTGTPPEPMPPVTPSPAAPGESLLGGLLQDRSALRRAIIFREVLGPPKALQTETDLVI